VFQLLCLAASTFIVVYWPNRCTVFILVGAHLYTTVGVIDNAHLC